MKEQNSARQEELSLLLDELIKREVRAKEKLNNIKKGHFSWVVLSAFAILLIFFAGYNYKKSNYHSYELIIFSCLLMIPCLIQYYSYEIAQKTLEESIKYSEKNKAEIMDFLKK